MVVARSSRSWWARRCADRSTQWGSESSSGAGAGSVPRAKHAVSGVDGSPDSPTLCNEWTCRQPATCGSSVLPRGFGHIGLSPDAFVLRVLDEVTTHLDAPTIRALARALKAYSGGIILITHDRWFSTVVVEGKPVDEGDDESSDEDEDDEAGIVGRRGVSYLVDKGKVKVLENGMEEYEKLVERRLARRRAKEGAGAP